MADVFVRRTTAFLITLVALLAIVCVALFVILFSSSSSATDDTEMFKAKDSERLLERHPSSSSTVSPPRIPVQEENSLPVPVAGGGGGRSDVSQKEPWEMDLRIPLTTIPYHYDLMLFPNLDTEIFTGHVDITIGVTDPMMYLVTHVKLMNITQTRLTTASGKEIKIKKAFEYEPNQFWVVQPKNRLNPGNYTLAIDFEGALNGHIVGFYMSQYTTKSGEKRKIATSKFQPTDARRAFPCFDEPSFKSTFKTTLIRPSQGGYVALSNMPVQKETVDSPRTGFTAVEFEKSVPMVTYLACFIVCDFDFVEVMTKDNKPFRVYSTKDQIDQTHYARDIGVNILNYFEDYFEVEYPLPKQDMIAIPDFVSGAMEHWGLITYRETNLLFDEIGSSSYNKQRVAAVVSHELAHMWFGNLVTLKWWNDLWLNEGFASYIEYKGISQYEKDWDMEQQFVIDDLHPVFKLDEILSSHPIVQPVNHPDEITEIFDKISYSKGASVLRMLENFLGPEKFRMGVSNFLKRFKYDNAITQDLWDDLQGVTDGNINMTKTMDTWTRQMGFPVVYVHISESNSSQLELSQNRFLIDADDQSADDSPYGYKWNIPVTYKTNNMERQLKWLKMENENLMIDRPRNSEFIKFNVNQYGYYRVNYDDRLWKELTNVLLKNHQVLSSSDRASLIDDSFSLAAARQLPYETAFEIVSYLSKETDYIPWKAAFGHLSNLAGLLQNTKTYTHFRKFVRKLVDRHVDRVGWEDLGTHTERRNRILIMSLACSNGHPGCIKGALEKFKFWIQDRNYKISANLRTLVYTYGIKGTGELEWNVLLNRYSKELNAQEKQKMLRGLASTKEPWIANNLIEVGRSGLIRSQDFLSMLNMMASNPSALSAAWDFVRNDWEWMVQKFGLHNRYLGRSVRTIAYKFTNKLELKELKQFFSDFPHAGSGKRMRSQALEKVEKNVKWVKAFAVPLQLLLITHTS